MLQATQALARRIERAECRLIVDMAESVRRRSKDSGVRIERIAGGAAVWAGLNSPLNKWIGLGFEGELDALRLESVAAEFARLGTAPRVELSSFAHASIEPLLARAGFQRIGDERVLALELDRATVAALQAEERAASGDVTVRRIDPAEARAWLDAVITGFLHPDGSAATPPTESFAREDLERAFSDTITVEGFDLHLAERGGSVAGGGGVRRFEGVAQLCGASTLPEHRRRGVQTALLRARLLAAASAGCALAVVTTEPDSKSQRNAEARGFRATDTRAIWLRA